MAQTAQALLVRHCASSGQAPEAPLSAEGLDQALQLADWLAAHPIDHVVSSPYLRARQTIEPFATRATLHVHIDERFAERRLSPTPIAEWRDVVAASFRDPDHCAPGGESGRETLSRAWAALESTLGAGHRLPVIVAHGQLLSLVLHAIDAGFGYDGWNALSNPDVFRLEVGSGGPYRFERLWRSPSP